MKLSIITINYNDVEGLKNTVNSVINQSWQEFEHIIIDGGSTDGSNDYIKENANYFSYAVSEADKGIYNAMNKGIAQACGEYLLMLNAGDVLHNVEVLKQVFENKPYKEDLIYGDVDRESKGVVFTESIFPDKLSFGFLRYGMISHQAVFIKKSLHELIGLYDETIKYGADWHFIILAVCKYNASHIHLKIKMALCSADGLTCNTLHFENMHRERNDILSMEFPAFVDDYLYFDELEKRRFSNIKSRAITNSKKSIKNIVKSIIRRK
ncbi:glycosyltransferase family 2 protein [Flavobacterium sp. 7A]|uniref:glycosyltransferase family 2 protein n=1 Tax=Flavobacterium sp. 7A TaxID=2940571 RepID=UPI0022271057|nr:glycosyltransferase family 2 protein [Flavobacterium sp. 7A]MCW2118489.1 glycosyltransferase involved in cell wall biosynthesis [Flavobacterium sp. 7A]